MSPATNPKTSSATNIDSGVDGYPWSKVSEHLDEHGWALVKNLLTSSECEAVAGLDADDRHFRSHIVMARHGFGRGEYRYFTYPLPETVANAAAAAVRRGRLQRAPPGPVRRTRLSAPGGDSAVRAGERLHRRRVCADRATAADAVARRSRAASTRRRDLPRCKMIADLFNLTFRKQ